MLYWSGLGVLVVVGSARHHMYLRKCRCLKCSRRHRSIVSSTKDEVVIKWFNALPYQNPAEYQILGRLVVPL